MLRLLSCGYTYGQIAGRLGISAHTVASHLKSCYRKLGVRRAAAAVARAAELGVLPEPLFGRLDR